MPQLCDWPINQYRFVAADLLLMALSIIRTYHAHHSREPVRWYYYVYRRQMLVLTLCLAQLRLDSCDCANGGTRWPQDQATLVNSYISGRVDSCRDSKVFKESDLEVRKACVA